MASPIEGVGFSRRLPDAVKRTQVIRFWTWTKDDPRLWEAAPGTPDHGTVVVLRSVASQGNAGVWALNATRRQAGIFPPRRRSIAASMIQPCPCRVTVVLTDPDAIGGLRHCPGVALPARNVSITVRVSGRR